MGIFVHHSYTDSLLKSFHLHNNALLHLHVFVHVYNIAYVSMQGRSGGNRSRQWRGNGRDRYNW